MNSLKRSLLPVLLLTLAVTWSQTAEAASVAWRKDLKSAAAEAEKSGGHDAVTGQVTIVGGRKQIPSQLHGEELVVGEIVVEGADHPVPPTPSIGEGRVLVKPIRVRVSRHVHPVSSPPFAVVGGLQQLIKRLVQSFHWRGMFKVAELLEGWGQSCQGQMKTPQQLVVFGR